MSSNVLKTSDCYNFNEPNDNESKPKTKHRQTIRNKVLTSKTNDLSKIVKKDVKWRCDAMKEVLKTALWLNDIRADSIEELDKVIQLLEKHISDECGCVNVCSTHILVGNTYYERFLFKQKQFENKVIEEEIKSDANSETDRPETEINDIPVQKESKLESEIYPHLVNMTNMLSLLESLKLAVDYWKKSFDLSLKLKLLTEQLIIGFKLYNNLSSVVQILWFYNQMEYRFKAVKLLANLCRSYSSKHSEISLTANYYLVKTYLELGAVAKAKSVLIPILSSISSSDQTEQMPDTYGRSLNLLAKCEVDLMSGRTQRAAKSLKSFIDCEYLQKLTINRYLIKGYALLLATKFKSKDFDFTIYCQEFIEPIQMSLSILKRWHPWMSTTANKPNNENQMITSGDLDPIWYKFATLNYSFDSIQMSAIFYGNIEMVLDPVFYYNAIFKIGRRYCATHRLSKLLIVGSELDVLCDYKFSAQIKLTNADLCLQSINCSKDSVNAFEQPSTSTICSETRTAVNESVYTRIDPEIEIIDVISCNSDFENFEDNQRSTFWDFKQKLMRKRNDSEGSENMDRNWGLYSLKSTDCSSEVFDLFFTKIEIQINRLLLNETDIKYILRQLNDIYLNYFETYAKILLSKIQTIISIPSYVLNDLFENCDYYKSLKFKLFETMAGLHVRAKQFIEAINVSNQMKIITATTYEQRIKQSNLFFFEGLAKLELYKSRHNVNTGSVWFEFDNFSVPEIRLSCSELESTGSQISTPPENKIRFQVPRAPKQRLFADKETEEYANALQNCVYEEWKSGKGGDNPFLPMRSASKLKFENHSELRTVSQSECNLNEESVPTTVRIVAESPKVPLKTTTSRMTRSRSAKSIKQEVKPIKKSKKLTKASAPELHASKEEELDEVFSNLKISETNENENQIDCTAVSSDITIDSIVSLFKSIMDLMATHPKTRLFVSIHNLLAEIYSYSSDGNKELIGYHFSEAIRSTYRYRYLFNSFKKQRLNKSTTYDLKTMVFTSKTIETNNTFRLFTDCLPTDWRIIQIMAVNNDTKIPDLMVCRYQSGKTPVFVRIKNNPEKIIKHFMTQFADIIERSNASIINKDRETFWRLRFSLDKELQLLLEEVEDNWFGPFKGILFGQLQNQRYQEMCTKLKSFILETNKAVGLLCRSQPLLEVLIESLPSLKSNQFRTALEMLFSRSSDDIFLKCSAKYEELFCDIFPIDNKESIFTTYELSPIGLILDKSLETFPFECLPTLQSYKQSIFRTPSLRVLSLMYNTFKDGIYSNGVDPSQVFYVLNPANNLSKTETYFKESFLEMVEWDGVIGEAPQPSQLKASFDKKSLYIFCGHGAGTSYYRAIPEGLDACNVNCASLIMGCSSGKLFSEGKQLETFGTPYRFLMNGCPSYTGVLWDVTDKDIDKFSDYLLSHWLPNYKPELNESKQLMPITRAVSMSRQFCKLKHLIGAAPVVYGLPLSSKRN